jgi:hypothetical protein
MPIAASRRFRFGLRTLFLAPTLFAVWLGWNVYQVRQRARMEQYVASIPSRFESNLTRVSYGPPRQPWSTRRFATATSSFSASASRFASTPCS